MSTLPTFSEVYAVPGQNSIIDGINPETGLTCVYGRTEADVKRENPDAVRMTWDAWQTAAAERQHTPIRWSRTDEHKYREMLEVLPPAAWIGGAFLVGEPYDHDFTTGQPRFSGYWHRNGIYLVASRPITIAELRAELGRTQ